VISLAARGLVLAAGVAFGCAGAGGVRSQELPASPLALLQRSEEVALDRVDALRDLEKRQGDVPREEGIAQLEDLDAMYGGQPGLERRLRPLQGQVVLLDPRSGETIPIEGAPPTARPLAWSPDRERLLLSGRWRDGVQLFVWERATRAAEIATAGPDEHPMGCVASDGRLVAVEVDRARGAMRLVTWPVGGGPTRRLTDGPWDAQPACSPARPQIAFVTGGADGSPVIGVLDLDAPSAPRPVARGLAPVFTPDGDWIVYAGRSTAGQRIWRVRAAGGGRAPVGGGTTEEGHPAVSPDGGYVAYVAVDAERRERLWVRRFDGTGDRPLLTAGDGASPAW
jgi:hypothetical protein